MGFLFTLFTKIMLLLKAYNYQAQTSRSFVRFRDLANLRRPPYSYSTFHVSLGLCISTSSDNIWPWGPVGQRHDHHHHQSSSLSWLSNMQQRLTELLLQAMQKKPEKPSQSSQPWSDHHDHHHNNDHQICYCRQQRIIITILHITILIITILII